MSTIIRYFVPEDRDLEDKPNAFIMYAEQNNITLKDIKDNFPLPGKYIFRFKTEYQKNKVWIDLEDDSNKIPLIDGKILIKVNRIDWNTNNDLNNNINNFADSGFPGFD